MIGNLDNEDDNIIDEIIKSLGGELEAGYYEINNVLTTNEEKNIKSQYEIVMNCDDSDYIIYYKKRP